jgi:hypothetical protein
VAGSGSSLRSAAPDGLKILRADQRKEQVHEQAQRHDSNNEVFHGSDPIEGIGIGNAHGKEADDCQHEYEVHHEPKSPRLDSVVVKTALVFFFLPREQFTGLQGEKQNSCQKY